jgi:hypothetical protein
MILLRTRPVVVVIIGGTAIAALLWLNHVRVGAWFWHLRHSTVSVGRYIVPVPKNWYPQAEDETSYLLARLDTDDTLETKRVKTHAGILIMASDRVVSEGDVSHMAALEVSLLQKHGVHNVTMRSVTLGRETLVCVGGDPLGGGIVDAEPESWRCNASGGLKMSITATQPDMKQVWEIVSGIRKES